VLTSAQSIKAEVSSFYILARSTGQPGIIVVSVTKIGKGWTYIDRPVSTTTTSVACSGLPSTPERKHLCSSTLWRARIFAVRVLGLNYSVFAMYNNLAE